MREPRKISVVIPAFNAQDHIASALGAVPLSIEVVVVANGCTDRTAAVARELRPEARIIEMPVASVGLARQVGLQTATGDYVAFRDADDVALPGSFEALSKALDNAPDIGLVCGKVRWVEDSALLKVSDYLTDPDELFADCLFRAPLHLASSMLRRSSFEGLAAVPLYPQAQDWDFLWRALCAGVRMKTISVPVVNYMRHPGATNANMPPGNDLSDFVTVLRAQFLAQCGVRLTPFEMQVFVNAAPCAYWKLEDVEFLRRLPNPREEVRAVFRKILRQNKLIPRAALARRMEQILQTLPFATASAKSVGAAAAES